MKKITLVLFIVGFLACEEMVKPGICTTQFVTSEVSVLNDEGNLVSGVTIEVKIKETGEILIPCGTNLDCEFPSGVYTVFHDGFMDKVSKNGDKIIVSGTKENLSFSQEFTFGKDDCHIYKLAGPDSVIISTQTKNF